MGGKEAGIGSDNEGHDRRGHGPVKVSAIVKAVVGKDLRSLDGTDFCGSLGLLCPFRGSCMLSKGPLLPACGRSLSSSVLGEAVLLLLRTAGKHDGRGSNKALVPRRGDEDGRETG